MLNTSLAYIVSKFCFLPHAWIAFVSFLFCDSASDFRSDLGRSILRNIAYGLQKVVHGEVIFEFFFAE